ncbi:MAG: pitrilysin family protein [Ignavibacteria bacterium]
MTENAFKDINNKTGNTGMIKNSGDVKITEYTLGNGLKLELTEDRSIPSLAINLCYHVGSKDEDPDKRGFAHLFEHLMFEGSKNVEPGDYDRLSLQAGCENNAYTTEDKTNYYLLAPSHQLEFGLWLESDRMLEFSVSEESLEIQKGVVIEEKKQVFDNRPYGSVSLNLAPLLYKNNGYSWDTIGDENDIESAALVDIKEFYEKYYTPNNAVLTLAGDFDTDEAIKLTEKYFGSIPKGKFTRSKNGFTDEPIGGEIKKIIYDDIQLPGIFGVYKVPKEDSKEFYIFDIMTDILSTGDSSRLYNELVYQKQLVSDVGCWVEGRELSGLIHFYAILMPGVALDEVQSEFDRIIDGVINGSLKQNELDKIKNRIETRHAYRMQTNLSKADMISHYKTFYNDPFMINTNIENYMSVTLKDIEQAAVKYLKKSGRVILNYLPNSQLKN